MPKQKKIAVVIPAYNEETQIGKVIETMPDFVDRIVIVNDKSKDNTTDAILRYLKQDKYRNTLEIKKFQYSTNDPTGFDRATQVVVEKLAAEEKFYTPAKIVNETPDTDRIIIIEHLENGGVGAAIATGYKWCRDHAIDCTAVMAGDGQMDPAELEGLCRPVLEENVDYVKGNRLIHPSASLMIPKIRFFGNSVLSIMTKMASGYWHISDTQTGYTTISLKALRAIKLYDIYKRYGMPNDMLVKLNCAFCTLREIEIKPVYNIGEQSKMKIKKVIPTVSALLFRSFFKRLYGKYLLRDFHPLFLLYHLAFVLLLLSIPYGIKTGYSILTGTAIGVLPVLAFSFLFTMGLQSLFFAMWMDIQDNERLNK